MVVQLGKLKMENTLNRILSLVVLLPAILFVVTGLRWLVAPAGVAPEFGLTLDHGVGLSSRVGDMAAFFLTLGLCMLTALVSRRHIWYYPPFYVVHHGPRAHHRLAYSRRRVRT